MRIATCDVFDFSKQTRGYVPALSLLCEHGYGLLVVLGKYPKEQFAAVRLERNLIANRKFKRAAVGSCLMQSEAFQQFDY